MEPSDNVPLCEFSKLPAQKVCMHSSCDQIPFLCCGDCVSNACSKLHRHNGDLRLVDYPSFQEMIRRLQDPNREQRELVEELTQSIHKIIESLNLMAERFKAAMRAQDMMFRTSAVTLSTLSKLNDHKYNKLIGKELARLADSRTADNHAEIELKIKSQTSRVRNIIESIEDLLGCFHAIHDFREVSEKHLQEAIRKSHINPRESILDYNKAIEYNPNNPLSILKRAETYMQLHSFDSALDDYNRVLNIDPNNAEVLNKKGILLMDHCSDPQKATQCFSKAISINPLQMSYRLNRSNALLDMGDYKEALKDINSVLEEKPLERWFYLKRAEILRKLGLVAEAEKDEETAERVKSRV